MKNLNTGGIVFGAIAWVGAIGYTTTQTACLKTNSCDGEDMVLFAIISLGMIGPVWIVALIASSIFKNK